MVRVRLKEECGFKKMNTVYGVVTHEWSVVRDDAYIYKEMEVDGLPKPEIVVEPVPTPKAILDPKPKPVSVPKPKVKVKKSRVSSVKKKKPKKKVK